MKKQVRKITKKILILSLVTSLIFTSCFSHKKIENRIQAHADQECQLQGPLVVLKTENDQRVFQIRRHRQQAADISDDDVHCPAAPFDRIVLHPIIA